MYDEWALPDGGEPDWFANDLVLLKLPPAAALGVVRSVVGQLSSGTLYQTLVSEDEVRWCMVVVGYGLMPVMTDAEQMNACVNIYCHWLSVLGDGEVHPSVPGPVRELPDIYAVRILRQLQMVFAPRCEPSEELVRCQVGLCHTVSSTIDRITASCHKSRLQPETWHELLTFTIKSTDFILSPPSVNGDIGEQLGVTSLRLLFNVWVRACGQCFPSPPLWRFLREHCQFWRHRAGLVAVWSRAITQLTKCVVANMYGSECACVSASALHLPADILCQVWFRMLHILGNPVDLSDAMTISHTQQFMRYAIVGSDVVEPCHHACLASLPTAFLASLQAVSEIANLFLGLEHKTDLEPILSTFSSTSEQPSFSVDLGPKRGGFYIADRLPSFDDDVASVGGWCRQMAFCHDERSTLMMGRPSCNSIVKLLGSWLFEAAAVGSGHYRLRKSSSSHCGWSNVATECSSSRTQISRLSDLPDNLLPDRFEEGRACALGVLCRIFCAKRFDEDITPIYLATFYRVLFDALCRVCDDSDAPGGHGIIPAILINGWRLLQVDLDGVNCLLPSLINALKLFFDGDTQRKSYSEDSKAVRTSDHLRNAAVRLLVSAVPLPMHFQSLIVRELGGDNASTTSANGARALTFIQLRPRLLHLLAQCLQCENDPINCQMLLSAASAVVLDSAGSESGLSCDESIDRHSSSQHSSSLPPAVDSSPPDPPLESVSGFYTRMLQLVTGRLVSTWKSDFGISVAALEFLSGMASVHMESSEMSGQGKLVIKRLCHFFQYQCSRPPQYHSKDLHSNMVVALQCICVWLLEHAYLLEDPELLQTVLTVVELGISGSVSNDVKEQKPLRPVSMRVSEMAETLLYVLMEQVGCVPSNGAATHTSSDLTENCLLASCPAGTRFKYVVCDSLLLALLDQPPSGSSKQSLPSVTLIIRGPSLRTAWNLQLRYKPRHLADLQHVNPGRPIPASTSSSGIQGSRPSRTSFPVSMVSYFPSEYFDGLTPCNADRSIPSLELLTRGEDFDTFRKCLDQIRIESQSESNTCRRNSIEERKCQETLSDCECYPPDPKEEFSTTRLLLCHLQLLDSVSKRSSPIPPVSGFLSNEESRVFPLDDQKPEFFSQLNLLDTINFRPRFLVNSYFVASGESDASEILRNNTRMRGANCDDVKQYGAFLSSLARPLPSSTVQSCESHTNAGVEEAQSAADLLIWTDDLVEFILAAPSQPLQTRPDCSTCTCSVFPFDVTSLKPTFVLVWLQNYADYCSFPLSKLVPTCSQVRCMVFVHPLKSGLFRVRVQWLCGGQSSSKSAVSASRSVLDSVLVGGRSLVRFLRQTIIASCHRGYLEAEIGHTPHAQRRIKINEIRQNFQSTACNSDFSWLSV